MTNLSDSDSQRLERIERLVEQLIGTVEKITQDQAEMKADIAEIKAEQAQMKADIAEIKIEQAQMRADIAEIKIEQAQMRADIAEIKIEQAQMRAEQAQMKADIAEIKLDIAEIKAEQTLMKAEQAQMKAEQTQMKAEQAQMKAEQTQMRVEQALMKAEQARMRDDIAGLTDDVAALTLNYDKLSQDMAVIKGWQTELVVERRARVVFRRLCGGGRMLRIYPLDELQHYIGAVRHAGSITEQEFERAGAIDFLLEGTDDAGVAVMFAVEVSYSAGIDDSDRAIGKAALLARALGREVRPAVAGAMPSGGFEDDARQRGVAYAYIDNGRDIVR